MKNLGLFLSLFLTQFLFTNRASARSCSEYLNLQITQEIEEHDILKAWKVYTLTNPLLEDSAKSYTKLITHYIQILEDKLSSKSSLINLPEQIELREIGNKKIADELKRIADDLYVRFEESKKYMDSNPDFYHSEIAAIKDFLNSMEVHFNGIMDDIIKTKLIFKNYQ
jgi:hypothetical protein